MSKGTPLFFSKGLYDDQFARTLASTYANSADLGEAFAVARSIGAKATPDSWYRGWVEAARRIDDEAATAERHGHTITARNSYLRASEYYRQAFFFLRHELDGPRLQDAYAQHARTFALAAPSLDFAAERVEIPYQDTFLHGWFFSPDSSGTPRPTVIEPDGYDSTAEEGLSYVTGALERGYNALTFDGPGQGKALYVDRLYMRPDFENVITPVVDWLELRADVDPTRLVLIGRSFAGYLAPRAAAFEHRIAALVCDPPDPDFGSHIPGGLIGRIAVPVATVEAELSADKAEFYGARMATHGVHDMKSYPDTLREFVMLHVADQITCPTLLVECEGDPLAGGAQGASVLAPAMTAPTTSVHLSAASGAGGHCGGLGQTVWNGVVYDWVDTILGR